MNEREEEKLKEALNAFVNDVKAFFNTREFIIGYLNEMYTDFLHGRDIQEQLETLKNASPSAFRLIEFLLTRKEEVVNEFIAKADLSEDEKAEIIRLKHTYRDLVNPIFRYIANSRGNINHWTNFKDITFSFNHTREIPQVEFKLFSFDKQIYHSKEDIDDLYGLARAFQGLTLHSLNMLKESDLKVNSDLLEKIKNIASDVEKDSKTILSIIEYLKKKQEESKLEEEETET